ncbi:MAG: hypothetical protein KC592_16840, partial [Nitrospira sp.]|nr:hypothetical protein [Nitrospira sp.]
MAIIPKLDSVPIRKAAGANIEAIRDLDGWSLPLFVFDYSSKEPTLYVTAAFLEHLRLSNINEDSTFASLIHPEDRVDVVAAFEGIVNRRLSQGQIKYRLVYNRNQFSYRYLWVTCVLARRVLVTSSKSANTITGVHLNINDVINQLDFFERFLDKFSGFAFAKSADHRFIYVNKTLADALKKSKGQVIGRTDEELRPDAKVENRFFWAQDEAVLSSGQASNIPREVFTKPDTGEKIILATNKNHIRGPIGATDFNECLVGLSANITQLAGEIGEAESLLDMLREPGYSLARLAETISNGLIKNHLVSDGPFQKVAIFKFEIARDCFTKLADVSVDAARTKVEFEEIQIHDSFG